MDTKITEVFDGIFFDAYYVDETLEVIPKESVIQGGAYSLSEAESMQKELSLLLADAKAKRPI
jgi:hypothetical protein